MVTTGANNRYAGMPAVRYGDKSSKNTNFIISGTDT